MCNLTSVGATTTGSPPSSAAAAAAAATSTTATTTTTTGATTNMDFKTKKQPQSLVQQPRRLLVPVKHNVAKQQQVYTWTEPDEKENLTMKDHFSSLLFGGSWINTVLELTLLAAPFLAIMMFGKDSPMLNVKGSMPLMEVAIFYVVCSVVRRVYNAYLEAVYFTFPSLRTQPPREHLLKQKKDLMGRDEHQLELLDSHDRWTMVSQFVLNFGLYYALAGFYPAALNNNNDDGSGEQPSQQSLQERFIRLVLNHYVMSFGMYWAHRSLHVVPWLWEHVHSIHHWAKHPLSRNTYEDHWLDNFFNAIVGHVYAQILVPLDNPTFWFSRIFRILESLEKHSGVSCGFNIAYTMQQWMPFAQMPHHHDWHHEGYKGSNYTFSSLGGLWDCIFGTRKGGRFKANHGKAATREDVNGTFGVGKGSRHWSNGFHPLSPLVVLTLLVGWKLKNSM